MKMRFFSCSAALWVLFSACQKNKSEQSFTLANDQLVAEEGYHPSYVGKEINAVYDGRQVTLLEIENGNYLYDGDVVLERNDFTLPGEVATEGTHAGGDWPNRTMPWAYGAGVSQALKDKWVAATNAWANELGFSFPQTNSRTKDYVIVRENSDGSAFSTSIGRAGGAQTISVDPNAFSTGSVIHEIGHAVGLHHEQKRPDRDNYISVKVSNIKTAKRSQYEPCNCTAIGTFDYNSIMLYGSFSNGNAINTSLPVMTRLDGTTWKANRTALSQGDIDAVNADYR
jgi:hypothetical protein